MKQPIFENSTITSSARVEGVIAATLKFAARIAPALATGRIENELFGDLKILAEMLQESYAPAEILAILNAPELAQVKTTLPKDVARIETELEKTEARKQLEVLDVQGAEGLAAFILYDKYVNLVRKEWLLYQQVAVDAELRQMRFLFAGCGALPMTAIGMAKTYGVRVDCYDVDAEAFALADRTVKTLAMTDQIKVYHGNAMEIDYSPYDIVIVANLAQPQMEILKRIRSYGNVRALIVRRVIGLVSLMYSSFDPQGLAGIGLELAATADPNDKKSVHQSVLLKPAKLL